MSSYQGVDFLNIDSFLSDEEKLVRQTVRRFVDEQVNPSIEEWNREGKFPLHLVKPMAELGFLGAGLSGYGGSGMNSVQYGLVMQELERGDSGLRSFVSVQSALVIYPISTYGSEEQKKTLAAPIEFRRGDRLFRPDRARLRLQPRRHADARCQGRRLLRSERGEDLDYLRQHRGSGPHLGAAGRGKWRCAGLPGGEGNTGVCGAGYSRETFAASFGFFEPLSG